MPSETRDDELSMVAKNISEIMDEKKENWGKIKMNHPYTDETGALRQHNKSGKYLKCVYRENSDDYLIMWGRSDGLDAVYEHVVENPTTRIQNEIADHLKNDYL